MAVAFVSTTLSLTALTIRRLESIWATGDPVMTVTRTAAVVTPIGIPTVIVIIAVVGTTAIGIGTPTGATVVTGVTDGALLQAAAVEDTRLTTGVVGATREARPEEAALSEVPDGTMRLRPQRPLQPVQLMRLVGERVRHGMGKDQNVFKWRRISQQSCLPKIPVQVFAKFSYFYP
jgi:hypothetical protein